MSAGSFFLLMGEVQFTLLTALLSEAVQYFVHVSCHSKGYATSTKDAVCANACKFSVLSLSQVNNRDC